MHKESPSSAVDVGRGPAAPGASAHERLLGRQLVAHGIARFGAALLIVVGAVLGRFVLGISPLNVPALAVLAGVVAGYNLCILLATRRLGARGGTERRLRVRRALANASIVLDFVALTAALWFLGGARSPFLAFYLLHIGIASILLSRRAACLAALLAAGLLLGLVLVEVTGLLPPPAPAGAVQAGPLDGRYVLTLLGAYAAMFGLIVLAQTQVAEALRRAEREAEARAAQWEELSRLRRAFLHVALHDVSSPIATAELLLRNLRDGLCGPMEPAQRAQVERAIAKLAGMQDLVRDLRILGELETTDLREHSTEIPLAFLLGSIVDEHADAARERGLSLSMEPYERAAIVFGVPMLIREAIANYVTNALKYTAPGGRVAARVKAGQGFARVEVSDTGVGIAPEDRARLFDEFCRVGRAHPHVAGVAGTGLGLSIVRRIVESHGGRVGVESEPGRGSTFWLELPECTGTEREAPAGVAGAA